MLDESVTCPSKCTSSGSEKCLERWRECSPRTWRCRPGQAPPPAAGHVDDVFMHARPHAHAQHTRGTHDTRTGKILRSYHRPKASKNQCFGTLPGLGWRGRIGRRVAWHGSRLGVGWLAGGHPSAASGVPRPLSASLSQRRIDGNASGVINVSYNLATSRGMACVEFPRFACPAPAGMYARILRVLPGASPNARYGRPPRGVWYW